MIFINFTSLSIVLFAAAPKSINGNMQGKTTPKFPSVIKHLESSLAASSAHGSVVAIRALDSDSNLGEDNNCIVVVSRCPTHVSQSNLTLSSILNSATKMNNTSSSNENETNVTGPVLSKVPGGFMNHNGMLYTIQGNAVMAATGLASDCKHLIRCAMMDVSRYEYIYGSRTKSIPFVKAIIVDGLVNRISRAAFSAGGRPFGVQFLSVTNSRRNRENRPSLEIYTIDPSGALRQWDDKAVAIGRFSQIILQNLYKKMKSKKDLMPSLKNETSYKLSIQEAIQLTIQSMIESEEDDTLQYCREVSNIASVCSEFEIVIVHSAKNGFSKVNNIRQLYEESILDSNM